MQLDAAILIILAIFTILGFKNGFIYTVFFAFGWIIAVVVAFLTREHVRSFLTEHTPAYDWYHGHVYGICAKLASGYADKFAAGAAGPASGVSGDVARSTGGALSDVMGSVGGIAGTLGEAAGNIGSQLAREAIEQIVSVSFSVLCFIATVLVVKLLLFLISLIFSRKYHGGFVGALDATAGLFLGLAQGTIIVFIALILILPVCLTISPGLFESATAALDRSFFAKTLFLNNPLVPLVDGFAPGMFDPAAWLGKLNS